MWMCNINDKNTLCRTRANDVARDDTIAQSQQLDVFAAHAKLLNKGVEYFRVVKAARHSERRRQHINCNSSAHCAKN